MSSRDEILARARKNLPPPLPLPAVPTFDGAKGSALERFKTALVRMGGKLADAPVDGDFDALIRRLFPKASVVCSATPEVAGNTVTMRHAVPGVLSLARSKANEAFSKRTSP